MVLGPAGAALDGFWLRAYGRGQTCNVLLGAGLWFCATTKLCMPAALALRWAWLEGADLPEPVL